MLRAIVVLVLTLTCTGWCNDPYKPRIAALQAVAGSTLADVTALVNQAGKEGADLVLLPMGIAGMDPQTTTGAMFQALSALAAEHDMVVVAPIRESLNGAFYNTAMVIGPKGELAGVYRQTHVCPEDRLLGVSAGNELPVFETRFGRIGILLGYDLLFREAPRIMALRGAKLLLYGYAGNSNEAGTGVRLGEAAFFDAYYVAMAGVAGSGEGWASNILGLDGYPIAIVGHGPCVVSAVVDLQDMTPRCFQQDSRDKLFACRDPYAVTELTRKSAYVPDQSPRTLKVACVQSTDNSTWEHIQRVLHRAGELGADVVITPEVYLPNPEQVSIEQADKSVVISTVRAIAAQHKMTVLAGMCMGVPGRANASRSSYLVVGPDGSIAGVHYQHTGPPADDFSLFDTGFGRFGGLVCWDLIIMGPEYARVEALKGARILFYGTMTIIGEAHDLALPSLAMTNGVPIAFSARSNNAFEFPQAGVVGPDGKYLLSKPDEAELGTELMLTEVNLALPSGLQALQQQLRNDRRPELYTPLIQSDVCLPESEVTWAMKDLLGGAARPAVVTAVTYNALFPPEVEYTLRLTVDGCVQGSRRVTYTRWDSAVEGCGGDFGYRFLTSTFDWMATPGAHVLTVEADADGEIAELRKDNNRVELHVMVPDTVTPTPTPGERLQGVGVDTEVKDGRRNRWEVEPG